MSACDMDSSECVDIRWHDRNKYVKTSYQYAAIVRFVFVVQKTAVFVARKNVRVSY